jgi:AraC family transcriptional regulator
LFIDHVLQAVGVHVAQTYGGMRALAPPARGGLAPWQVRRAKEIFCTNLDGRVQLKEVAQECRLSVSHFSRAFRRSMGVAPHNWLLTRRVEVAKEKLRDDRLSLSDVALACGFADQSHLTRVFTRMVGVSPGAWRRALDQELAATSQPRQRSFRSAATRVTRSEDGVSRRAECCSLGFSGYQITSILAERTRIRQ